MCAKFMLAPAGRRAVTRSFSLLALGAGLGAAFEAPPAIAQAAAPPATSEREQTISLDAILLVALDKNPELNEAKLRSRAAREGAPAVSRWPDPELEYQLWAQPLARPWAVGEAQMHMVGVRQTIPAPGTSSNRAEAASARADVAQQSYQARRLELVGRVRRAYAAYYLADRELQLHREHARLAEQVTETSSAMYRAGRGAQQDVLRANLEVSRLHSALIQVEASREAARGLLNTLMGRDPASPLAAPANIDVGVLRQRATTLRSSEERPELAAQRSVVKAEERELAAARAAGTWPTFMVGAQYMYMPTMTDRHNYGLMLSMSLPWFNARYGEQERAAEARLSAEQSALQSARLATQNETFAARQRLTAAAKTLDKLETSLLPEAQQSFESARASYRGGQLDSMALLEALRTLLDVRTERERAVVGLEMAAAELERATASYPLNKTMQEPRR
jgi:outer membrane protein, heavy metal efflux system